MNPQLPIGQGHGVPERYAGLPDQYAEVSSSKIVLLPSLLIKQRPIKKEVIKGLQPSLKPLVTWNYTILKLTLRFI